MVDFAVFGVGRICKEAAPDHAAKLFFQLGGSGTLRGIFHTAAQDVSLKREFLEQYCLCLIHAV